MAQCMQPNAIPASHPRLQQSHQRALHAAHLLLQQQVPFPHWRCPAAMFSANAPHLPRLAKRKETSVTRPQCLSDKALTWWSRYCHFMVFARLSRRSRVAAVDRCVRETIDRVAGGEGRQASCAFAPGSYTAALDQHAHSTAGGSRLHHVCTAIL